LGAAYQGNAVGRREKPRARYAGRIDRWYWCCWWYAVVEQALDKMVSSLSLYGVAMRQRIDAKHLLITKGDGRRP